MFLGQGDAKTEGEGERDALVKRSAAESVSAIGWNRTETYDKRSRQPISKIVTDVPSRSWIPSPNRRSANVAKAVTPLRRSIDQ
jgi:hypothetical protein